MVEPYRPRTDGERLAFWLAGDDCGISSKTIALRMCGVPNRRDEAFGSHPRDPADLGRCVRLLALYPMWRARLAEVMTPVSPEWAALVARWDELERSLMAETGLQRYGSAPQTHDLMQGILRGSRGNG